MILEIIQYGHPVLRAKGKRIDSVTPEIRQLAADMIETMYAANGVGLAAQQVSRALMMTVIDIRESDRPSGLFIAGQVQEPKAFMPLVLLNPTITGSKGEEVGEEGCLSIPEVNAGIRRAAKVTVQAQTLDGTTFTFDATGLLGRAVQHELDHLNGILFTDRMDAATRASVAGKLKKLQKETQEQLKEAGKSRRSLARL